MRYFIAFFFFIFISCNDSSFDVEKDILKIEDVLQIQINGNYEIIEEENSYPIKGDIVHFVSFKFDKSDYENILNLAILFFNKSVYDPLNPGNNLNTIYYEFEENGFRYSIYIDMELKTVNYSSVDLT